MAQNFIQEGITKTLPFTTTVQSIKSGDFVQVGDLGFFCSKKDTSRKLFVLQSKGVWEAPKPITGAAATFTDCQAIYWDATNKVFTNVATNNKLVGYAWEAAEETAPTFLLRLN